MSRVLLSDRLPPALDTDDLVRFVRLGIDAVTIWTTTDDAVARSGSLDAYLTEARQAVEAHGMTLLNVGLLDLHCEPVLVLDVPGRREAVDRYKDYLRALGRAGIGYTTYAHMANIKEPVFYATGWVPGRGGMQAREFDLDVASQAPWSTGREHTADEVWGTFTELVQEVVPVAEQAGVRIGLHPDDPPVPSLGGIARVFADFAGYRRALEIAGSPSFGLCFCAGTWAEGAHTGPDLVAELRDLATQGSVFKVHFRNVDATLPRFRETLPDEGWLDMAEVLDALAGSPTDVALLPDHVPGGELEAAYTVGYIRALVDSRCAR